jgi:crossover junction endodeoxyribonuclease RuvC
MYRRTVIGIDPGLTGAVAVLNDGIRVFDMPVSAKVSGKGQQVNAHDLATLLRSWMPGSRVTVYVEKVASMPKQGVASTFNFGETAGVIRGVVAALGLELLYVTPQKWKKHLGLLNMQKDAARTLAIQLYPGLADDLARKKDGGRADAILIARYGQHLLENVSHD